MIQLLTQKIAHFPSQREKYNFLREYLQLLILKILDEQGFFQHLAFLGGTALRILYNLERFSDSSMESVKYSRQLRLTILKYCQQKYLIMRLCD